MKNRLLDDNEHYCNHQGNHNQLNIDQVDSIKIQAENPLAYVKNLKARDKSNLNIHFFRIVLECLARNRDQK